MNDKFYLIRSLKRSGNHLVINWIRTLDQIDDMGLDAYAGYNFGRTQSFLVDASNKQKFIISIEQPLDIKPEEFDTVYNYGKKWHGFYDMAIIRDPANWAASIVVIHKDQQFTVWDKWISFYGQYLKSGVQVSYNEFVSSFKYRQDLAERLSIKFDASLDAEIMNTLWRGPGVGIPSSFDTDAVQSMNMNPYDMKVFERYKTLEIEIPPEIRKICGETFGLTLTT